MKQVVENALPELWGGVECTINRKHDKFKDQLHLSGSYYREGDIKTFATLGIKALRFPVLWESHYNEKNEKTSLWKWTSQQLSEIKSYQIEPIVGLVHHGSGPAFTSLADEQFPFLLAKYAGEVAACFPWINYYTPVNEPLTTARFSGLYGHWYPHHTSDHTFLTILLNQVEGIIRSMEAIRKINPAAKLVQTEDLAYTHSTPGMKYQADFDNHRRWLSYDLLCGKVDPQHPLYHYFIDNGISPGRLGFFLSHTCMPDIAGFNYYVTSERYLDQRLKRYPSCMHGSNGKQTYVDTEAVRRAKPLGISKLLTQAWKRYHIPLAVTEAHLECTREEQLRWFKEIWDSCCLLRQKGLPVIAVTAWSLLGSFDWDSLLVRDSGNYQVGVFDISNDKLRPTAMVYLIRSLSKTGDYKHPLMDTRGWWHRHNPRLTRHEKSIQPKTSRPMLIIGKNGTLGTAFKIICEHRGINHIVLSREDIDITNPGNIAGVFQQYKPWCVINTTGYVQVDNAEKDIDTCFAVNAIAPGLLSEECYRFKIPFLTFSSDMVFNGDKGAPYIETDETEPINTYGKSKAAGEASVFSANPGALVIRSSAFFGPWDRYNFVYNVVHSLDNNHSCKAVNDVLISPTYVPDLVHASLDLLIDGSTGIWHLSNEGVVSWAGFAEEVAKRAGHSTDKIIETAAEQMAWHARRPLYSVLESSKGVKLPFLLNAIDRYFIDKAV